MVEVVVEFPYEAEQEDELTLKIGDVVKNVVQSDGGWWEGELGGKKGMFPTNFVKVVKIEDKGKETPIAKKEAPQRKSVRELASKFKDNMPLGAPPKKRGEKKKKCRVAFDYAPENEDELELKEGEIVEFLREVEDGWWEGSLNNKTGVFPSNFVVMLEDTDEGAPPDLPEKPSALASQGSMDKEAAGGVHEIKGKKVIGVGLGNIFQGGPIKLKTQAGKNKDVGSFESKKLAPDVKEPARPPPPETAKPILAEPIKPMPAEPVKAPPPEPAKPPVAEPEVVRREKKVQRAMVRFSYTAEQPDEISLKEGETINVLETNLEDEGWWKGEVAGKVGVFPDNFVELLPEPEGKPKKPPPPSISTIPKGPSTPSKTPLHAKVSSDKGPAPDPHVAESKKHDAKHDVKHEVKHDIKTDIPTTKNKDHSEPSNDRVANTSSNTAAKKPFVPPPPVGKKPPHKPEPHKPTEQPKVESKVTVGARDNKTREHKEEVEQPDVLAENENEDSNFESLEPTSQKLIHLTASRAKGPKKRPPSGIFPTQETDVVDSEDIPTIHQNHKPTPSHKEPKQSSPTEPEKKASHLHEHSNHHTAPPRPPEPSHPPSAGHGSAALSKALEDLQREVRDLRANSVSRSAYNELRADYDQLKQEVDTFKSSCSKKIRELIIEVDEEKKLRLNTQVEIERIKKLLVDTDV